MAQASASASTGTGTDETAAALAQAVGADAEAAGMTGTAAAALEAGYAGAKQAIAKGEISVEESAGLALAGAAAGSAIMPGIGTAIGAVAGLAVSIGVALADLFGDQGGRRQAPVFDRFTIRMRPAKQVAPNRYRITWTLGRSAWEQALTAKPTGRSNMGTVIWLLRRIREDGGGSAEYRRLMDGIGAPYSGPDPAAATAADAVEASAPMFEAFRTLGFLSAAVKNPPESVRVYVGARLLGLDRVAARRLAGLPDEPFAAMYLADLRATLERELPPPVPAKMSTAAFRAVPESVKRLVADKVQGKITIPTRNGVAIAKALVSTRAGTAGGASTGALVVGGLALAGAGWYFLGGKR